MPPSRPALLRSGYAILNISLQVDVNVFTEAICSASRRLDGRNDRMSNVAGVSMMTPPDRAPERLSGGSFSPIVSLVLCSNLPLRVIPRAGDSG